MQLYQYQEDFSNMLHELSVASSLDPVWSAPIEKSEAVWNFLKSMAHLVTTKVILLWQKKDGNPVL